MVMAALSLTVRLNVWNQVQLIVLYGQTFPKFRLYQMLTMETFTKEFELYMTLPMQTLLHQRMVMVILQAIGATRTFLMKYQHF